jgi:NAD(P)-dependent dehydrogenase (short-subunit alcohol dehydrogenase family)
MSEDAHQRTAVVTGASSGIGKAAARMLAAEGWHVIALGRDPERCAAAETEIRAAMAPGARVEFVSGDLSLIADIDRMADAILALTDKVDALLLNAGGPRAELVITPEGLEATFAGNHLGHFLLTRRLSPVLRAAAADAPAGSVRVVSVSSLAQDHAPAIDWSDLQYLRNWASGASYCQAKLFNMLFTSELGRRMAPYGIVAHAMHPGIVASNFASHCEPGMKAFMETRTDADPPEIAADTLVWLAKAPEHGRSTGGYFYNRAPAPISAQGQDDAAAARLWEESEKLLARLGR